MVRTVMVLAWRCRTNCWPMQPDAPATTAVFRVFIE